ncbi:MAG: hypothetical protein JNN16_10615 [Nitrospira sp.]|nr:hypothetical protein [Nitrospira sp.]
MFLLVRMWGLGGLELSHRISPYYGRMIVVSVFADQAEAVRVQDFLADEYPALDGRPVLETLLQAAQLEIRLYEVMPYPRYPRDFRRH